MAKFAPYKILSTQLDSLPIEAGQFILTTDTQLLYADISDTERVLINEKANNTPTIYMEAEEPTAAIAGDYWLKIEEQ